MMGTLGLQAGYEVTLHYRSNTVSDLPLCVAR